jgi:hypothetical protein
MELTLKAQWVARLKLRAQADTLWAQADTPRAQGDTLWAQADTLWAQSDTLRAQANTLWANAIIEVFGNIKLKITDDNGVNYELENGEIYRADMPTEGE